MSLELLPFELWWLIVQDCSLATYKRLGRTSRLAYQATQGLWELYLTRHSYLMNSPIQSINYFGTLRHGQTWEYDMVRDLFITSQWKYGIRHGVTIEGTPDRPFYQQATYHHGKLNGDSIRKIAVGVQTTINATRYRKGVPLYQVRLIINGTLQWFECHKFDRMFVTMDHGLNPDHCVKKYTANHEKLVTYRNGAKRSHTAVTKDRRKIYSVNWRDGQRTDYRPIPIVHYEPIIQSLMDICRVMIS